MTQIAKLALTTLIFSGVGAIAAGTPKACLTRESLGEGTCKNGIRILVGSSAGGSTDMFARELSLRAQGVTVVVDNAPGASGHIAALKMKLNKIDSCTVMMGSNPSLAMNNLSPVISNKINPTTEYEPIGLIARNPLILIVDKRDGVETLAQLRKLLAEKRLSYGTTGVGSPSHLATYKIEQLLDTPHSESIPYTSNGAAGLALKAGGEPKLHFFLDNPLTAEKILKNDKNLVAVGTTSDDTIHVNGKDVKPLSSMDTRLKGINAEYWFGLVGNKPMNEKVKAAMSKAIHCLVNDSAFAKTYKEQGYKLGDGSPQELSTIMSNEVKNWGPVFKEAAAGIGGTSIKVPGSNNPSSAP